MKKKNTIRKKRNIREIAKECYFCHEKKNPDFLDSETLKKFISERGKILSRQRTGTCSKHQRKLTVAIKRARYLALLPFIVRAD